MLLLNKVLPYTVTSDVVTSLPVILVGILRDIIKMAFKNLLVRLLLPTQ